MMKKIAACLFALGMMSPVAGLAGAPEQKEPPAPMMKIIVIFSVEKTMKFIL